MSLTLEGALITSYSLSDSGGDTSGRPVEMLALRYTTVAYTTATAGRLIPGAKAKP
jgi:hypothetical protein